MTMMYSGVVFIALFVVAVYTSARGCDSKCKCIKKEMICVDYMPSVLPTGINDLIVNGTSDHDTEIQFWKDNSWGMLKSLTLRNYPRHVIELYIYNFSNLVNLTSFGLHSNSFDQLYSQHLKAMPYLKELDLSGTNRLTFPRIISALLGGNLPNLEVLNLDSVASDGSYTGINRFDDTFIDVLVGKPLRKLIITNTMLEININAMFRLDSLEFVNISGPWIPLYGPRLAIPNGKTLKTLDLSYSAIHVFKTNTDIVFKDIDSIICEMDPFSHLLIGTNNLFINNIVEMSVSYVNVKYNTSCFQEKYKCHIKSLHLRRNGLKILDIEIDETLFSGLTILDLSENILEYISPDFFKMANLSTLTLSVNNLYQMEHKSNFELLFKHLKNLRSINLSSNQISVIPRKTFMYNRHLSVINLSFNKISEVNFQIQHLSNLSVLNLEGNQIQIIEIDFLYHLDKLSFNPSFNKHQTDHNVIILSNNQIYCTCRNVAFLNWMVSRYEVMETTNYPSCILEGKLIRLDQTAVEDSKYLCIKNAVIISVSTSCAFVTISTILISIVCYIRRRRRVQIDRVKRLKRLLQNQNGLKYLSFFSFCGEDENLARYSIYPRLVETIQAQVGCARNLLCIGDIVMMPGFPIHEQIHERISESYLAIAIVTNNFCESHWCETELREAIYQNKPIIMFIVDHVDEHLMSPYIQNIFRRYTRVKVTTKGDGLEFTPEVDVICRSMLELAAYVAKH